MEEEISLLKLVEMSCEVPPDMLTSVYLLSLYKIIIIKNMRHFCKEHYIYHCGSNFAPNG